VTVEAHGCGSIVAVPSNLYHLIHYRNHFLFPICTDLLNRHIFNISTSSALPLVLSSLLAQLYVFVFEWTSVSGEYFNHVFYLWYFFFQKPGGIVALLDEAW